MSYFKVFKNGYYLNDLSLMYVMFLLNVEKKGLDREYLCMYVVVVCLQLWGSMELS